MDEQNQYFGLVVCADYGTAMAREHTWESAEYINGRQSAEFRREIRRQEKKTAMQGLRETVSGTDEFMDKAKRYTDISELTPELLQLQDTKNPRQAS